MHSLATNNCQPATYYATGRSWLHSVIAGFSGADANDARNGSNEDFPIANIAGSRRRDDQLNRLIDIFILDDDHEKQFWHKSQSTITVGDFIPLAVVEKLHVRQVVASSKSMRQAASILGIDPGTVQRRMKRYGESDDQSPP